jgi:protein-S-isoprenylcysteine O-methyltransferase Ste14
MVDFIQRYWWFLGGTFGLVLSGVFIYQAIKSERFKPWLNFPRGFPKFKEEAPRSTHLLVGIAATVTGIFFMYCGVALVFDAEWSRISHPVLAASICMFLAGLGALFLYLAWRCSVQGHGQKLPNSTSSAARG